jgi:hypothetical protein
VVGDAHDPQPIVVRHEQLELDLWRYQDFRLAYHHAMAPIVRRWQVRARAMDRCGEFASAKYARDRASTLLLDPDERMRACETRHVTVRCKCRSVRVPVPCGQRWLCPRCQRRTAKRQFRRLKRATKAHYRAAYRLWQSRGCPRGAQRRWVLITLTVRHSGDLVADRRTIITGWRRLRQWLWARTGAVPYALAWEVTPGDDLKGHLHAHVAALLPFVDYETVRNAWLRATDGNSQRINIASARKGPGGAAAYLSKYVSKGVEVEGMPPVLAASVIAANYGKRLYTTSHRFWVPHNTDCACCNSPFAVESLPLPLRCVAPYAVWDALARGYGVDRGPPPPVLSTKPTG